MRLGGELGEESLEESSRGLGVAAGMDLDNRRRGWPDRWRRRRKICVVLLCALRRIGLAHTQFAAPTCGTIRLKLLKIGALVKISSRRVKIAFASACPSAAEWRLAARNFSKSHFAAFGTHIAGWQEYRARPKLEHCD